MDSNLLWLFFCFFQLEFDIVAGVLYVIEGSIVKPKDGAAFFAAIDLANFSHDTCTPNNALN
jgi:hypothetical protein